MPVAHARVKLHLLAAQLVVQLFDQLARLLGGDMPGAVVLHLAVHNSDKIASKDPVIHRQVDIASDSLDGRPPRIIAARVVSKQAHLRHVTARLHPRRHGPHEALPALGAYPVHVRRLGRFQRSGAVEFFKRLIGGAVRNDNCIFCHLSVAHVMRV